MTATNPEHQRDMTDLEHLHLAVTVAGVDVAEVVAPTPHHVLLRNRRFHYLDWGGASNIPIVFLHGAGLSAHTWDLVCLLLRPLYRCYALDLRGHGDSEWSTNMDYTSEAHAGDVDAFISHLELSRPVVVGMSLGGMAAVRYASGHPLGALVVIDTAPEMNRAGSRRILDFFRDTVEFGSVDEFVAQSLQFNPRRDPRLLRRTLLRNLVQLPDGNWTWRYDRRHYGRIPEENRVLDRGRVWGSLDQIRCPVLVVRGAESDLLSPRGAEDLARVLPDGRWIEIAGAGHTVQGDNPKDLAAEIETFLAGAAL
jgi:esterase